eukprot:1153857-Pelagomonas_calceolata.AAC.3
MINGVSRQKHHHASKSAGTSRAWLGLRTQSLMPLLPKNTPPKHKHQQNLAFAKEAAGASFAKQTTPPKQKHRHQQGLAWCLKTQDATWEAGSCGYLSSLSRADTQSKSRAEY